MKAQIIQERLKQFEHWSLAPGAHSPDSTFCIMEAVAYVAGEKWSDKPDCACPIISTFLRSWNDALPSDAERDRLLKPLIPTLVNTHSTKEIELKRGLMAADWLIRVHTPAWLRFAGLTKQAESLEQLPEITAMKQFPSLGGPLEAVRQDAAAARNAARAAARAAAWDAAENAAWAAAWAAAWDAAENAARNAARAAAWAAAENAAWAAAWAKLAQTQTVALLQQSALELVRRMIEVS